MARKATTGTTATAKKPATKAAVKETAAKEAAVKTVEKTAEKASRTTAAKKAPSKKATLKPEVFVQYWGKEILTDDVVEAVKNVWTGEMGKDASELKELKVYIKPEDNGAHFVINGEVTGFVEI